MLLNYGRLAASGGDVLPGRTGLRSTGKNRGGEDAYIPGGPVRDHPGNDEGETAMPLLNPGDPFPRLTIETAGGQSLTIPDAFAGDFANPDPAYLQSTDFVLDPGGKVIVSVYSSGAIGRLVPDDVIGLVRYLREHSAPATA
jgi:hypothetical protein